MLLIGEWWKIFQKIMESTYLSQLFLLLQYLQVFLIFLSIKDAENNQFNDSFSNTYGSNIFDICVGIGLPIFIYSLFNEPFR